MFSTCSELTLRAPIPDGRMEQIMQPCLSHMCVDVWWLCSEFCHFICLLSSDLSLPLRSFPEVRLGLGSWCSVSDVPVRGSELKERPGRRHPLFAPSCPASCPRGGMAAGYGGSRALVFLHHSSWCLAQRTSSIKEMFVAMLCWLDSLRIEETFAESEQCHMP